MEKPRIDLTGFSEDDKKQLLAQAIERHVGDYQPQHWVEPVRVCSNCPELSAEDGQELTKLHKEGKLAESLETYANGKFKVFFLKEGILDFFRKDLHKIYL